jgi:hypothetical protein
MLASFTLNGQCDDDFHRLLSNFRFPPVPNIDHLLDASSSQTKMRYIALLLVLTTVGRSLSFQPRVGLKNNLAPQSGSKLQAAKDGDKFQSLIPETSFGADAVPEAQRPVNEYLDVTRQPLFGWASNESGSTGLLIRLVILYGVVFGTVCYPISGATYTGDDFLLQKLASSNVGALLLIIFVLIRIYSGWEYLGSRLNSKVIEYEETGWYDGDFELKGKTERQRDKFLYTSEVKPVVERLKTFIFASGGLWIASCVGLNLAMQAKPIFNEYDPAVLEQVQYNDKLADQAAMNSGGRPTYCNSRYYRAVAGGGQGCD